MLTMHCASGRRLALGSGGRNMVHEDASKQSGGMLTKGKRKRQAEKLTPGKRRAYLSEKERTDRLLRLGWLALMLNFSGDIGGHIHEFEEVVLGLPRHSFETTEESQVPRVSNPNSSLFFR